MRVYGNRDGNTDGLTQGDIVLNLPPVSFIHSGRYDHSTGNPSARTSGYYWSLHIDSATNAYHLGFYSGDLNTQNAANRGRGLLLRCLAR